MNYKRKKSRTCAGKGSYDRNRQRKAHPDLFEYLWLNGWPRWWDILFFRRPHRRKASGVTRSVLRGNIDADEAIWPVVKKPHRYYW